MHFSRGKPRIRAQLIGQQMMIVTSMFTIKIRRQGVCTAREKPYTNEINQFINVLLNDCEKVFSKV